MELKVTNLDKETVEAVNMVLEVAVRLIPILKDGVQVSDALKIVSEAMDPQLQATVKAGVEGMNLIPGEISHWGVAEVTDMGMLLVGAVPRIIEALKKPVA